MGALSNVKEGTGKGEDLERVFSVLKPTKVLLALGSAHMLSPKSGRHVQPLFPPWLAFSHCLGVGLNEHSAEDIIQKQAPLASLSRGLSVFFTAFLNVYNDCFFIVGLPPWSLSILRTSTEFLFTLAEHITWWHKVILKLSC